MYKIRQVAEILDVPTVQIHEKLISLSKELRQCLYKTNSITYIDESGLVIIKKAFDLEHVENAKIKEAVEKKANSIIEEQPSFEKENGSTSVAVEKNRHYDLRILELKDAITKVRSEIKLLDERIEKIDGVNDGYINVLESIVLNKDDLEKLLIEYNKRQMENGETHLVEEVLPKRGFLKSFMSK